MDEWITFGKILKPVGMKGALKVVPLSDVPGRFTRLPSRAVSVRLSNGRFERCIVEEVRELHHTVILSFENVRTPQEAARFIAGELRISPCQVPRAPDGIYYHFELIGLTVYLEDGRYLGVLEEVLETKGNDVFIVRNGPEEHLIPALRSVVVGVDRSGGKMVVRPMPGMVNSNEM